MAIHHLMTSLGRCIWNTLYLGIFLRILNWLFCQYLVTLGTVGYFSCISRWLSLYLAHVTVFQQYFGFSAIFGYFFAWKLAFMISIKQWSLAIFATLGNYCSIFCKLQYFVTWFLRIHFLWRILWMHLRTHLDPIWDDTKW